MNATQHRYHLGVQSVSIIRTICVRDDDVQGVLTLFCSRRFSMTIVWWSSRNSSRWKEDGDRQEEAEVESGEGESRRARHVDDHGWRYEMRSELEQ